MPEPPTPNELGTVTGSDQCDYPAVSLAAWKIQPSDAGFPARLTSLHEWKTLHGIGNRRILQQKCMGLICSVQCPGSVVIKTFDVIREMRDAGIVIAGGFHSPMEQECLEFLLRGEQAVIICPARSVSGFQIPKKWRGAIVAGRLLLLSPFEENVRQTTAIHAQTRNEFVAHLSDAVLVPHASPSGKAEAITRRVVGRSQPLFTLYDAENADLLKLGASVYEIEAIRRLGFGRKPDHPYCGL